MQACNWKAHNTFTNFYLKDLTWSDNDNNMYLGPVVAAPQVLDPSPQTSYLQKEKKGGGGHICYNKVFRSLILGSRYRFTSQDVTGKVIFTPQPLRAVGVLFSPMVSGWAGGGKEFVRAVSQKPQGVGSSYLAWTLVGGCRCATPWSDLDLTLL